MIEPMLEATLLSFEKVSQQDHVDAASTALVHGFTDMTLQMATKTCSVYLELSAEQNYHNDTITKEFDRVVGEQHYTFKYYLDRPDGSKKDFGKVTFGLLLEARSGHESNLSRSYGARTLIGLVLAPEFGGNTYRHIGLWTLHVEHEPAGWEADNIRLVQVQRQLHCGVCLVS
jgi:hypothetical protein